MKIHIFLCWKKINIRIKLWTLRLVQKAPNCITKILYHFLGPDTLEVTDAYSYNAVQTHYAICTLNSYCLKKCFSLNTLIFNFNEMVYILLKTFLTAVLSLARENINALSPPTKAWKTFTLIQELLPISKLFLWETDNHKVSTYFFLFFFFPYVSSAHSIPVQHPC